MTRVFYLHTANLLKTKLESDFYGCSQQESGAWIRDTLTKCTWFHLTRISPRSNVGDNQVKQAWNKLLTTFSMSEKKRVKHETFSQLHIHQKFFIKSSANYGIYFLHILYYIVSFLVYFEYIDISNFFCFILIKMCIT